MFDYSKELEANIKRGEHISNDLARHKAQEEYDKSASGVFERLQLWIEKEKSQLEADEQLQVVYYNRAGKPIYLNQINYYNPQMIILRGEDPEGNSHRLIMNMNLVELDLIRLKMKGENKKQIKLGFAIENIK